MSTLFSRLILSVSAIILGACTPGSFKVDPNWSLNEFTTELFSNRPAKPEAFIGIVTLKGAPLLEVASYNDEGKPKVALADTRKILAEQAEFEKLLETEAPNVKVIYRYRFVLNGFAVHGPGEEIRQLKSKGLILNHQSQSFFALPKGLEPHETQNPPLSSPYGWDKANSSKFIGSEALHAKGFTGKGLTVGIIDTGVDYTHKMLGGLGDPEIFTQMDGNLPSEHFPNKKVVGGVDLVGSNFTPFSIRFAERIPHPDSNPMDEAGHGTHVAGTVAGIGDGVETYSGVAPEAELHAIKVFAKTSTADHVVIAAFEYSIDPNGDMNPLDRLDVVNLSLGGGFGGPKELYTEVIERVTQKAGMIVVAAAGNSGPIDFVTGAPATATEAISVAASVDDSFHNWKLPGIGLVIGNQEARVLMAPPAEFAELAQPGKKIQGPVIHMGYAAEDPTPEVAAQVAGHIALIQRGQGVPFAIKAARAEQAGAIAVVIYNNENGPAPRMGGDGKTKVNIPTVGISQAEGLEILKAMQEGLPVTISFGDEFQVTNPQIIDTVTEFSSKGPRSDDLLIKPEISAPGQNIHSALIGTGDKGGQFSGTSMAAPHVAGAMALLRQAYPKAPISFFKTLVMNTAKPLQNGTQDGLQLVTLQGAGRIQLAEAIETKAFVQPSALSLGVVQLDQRKRVRVPIIFTNADPHNMSVHVGLQTRYSNAVKLVSPSSVIVKGRTSQTIFVDLEVTASALEDGQELDGWVTFVSAVNPVLRVPFLMFPKKTSNIQLEGELQVFSDPTASVGAAVELTLANQSGQKGLAFLFNLLGKDERKADPTHSKHKSKLCDIQSVGYRLANYGGKDMLQIAVKLYNPVTHWSRCEVAILFDGNNDQTIDQELAYITAMNVPGLTKALGGNPLQTASVLFDSGRMRYAREEAIWNAEQMGEVVENYLGAVEDAAIGYGQSHGTIVVLEVDTAKLQRRPTGEVAIKVASQDGSGLAVEFDDFFQGSESEWMPLSLEPEQQGYNYMPLAVEMEPKATLKVDLVKGAGSHPLMILLPNNEVSFSEVVKDQQQIIGLPKYW